jgi:hypothetical protein
MTVCPKCGLDNPAGSKFCAGCGTAIPMNPRCASCGTESPAGSNFCKSCGALLQGTTQSPPPVAPRRQGIGARAKGAALSENLAKVKWILWASAGLCAIGLYLNYASMSRLRAYLGPFADTSTSWFFIILDIGLGGFSVFSASKLEKGDLKPAKMALLANAIVGGIATLLYFKGGIIPILLNGGLLACGIWGRMLISKEERPLV